MDQTKDVIQNLGVVRFLLELHQLIVDGVQALAGLRQKLSQKIVHEIWPSPMRAQRALRVWPASMQTV
jgi:hypothetical protein